MNFKVLPNFKVVGKIFGANLKEFQANLSNLSIDDINKLRNEEGITMVINSTPYNINHEMVDIRIDAKEGFNVGMQNNNFVILNTKLDDNLIYEGIAREIVSKVQQMRKNTGLELTDRINIYYNSSELIGKAINEFEDYIKNETLALSITVDDSFKDEFNIGEETISVRIEKAN